MVRELPPLDDAPRAPRSRLRRRHRTWPQRLLLSVGCVLAVGTLVAAGVVAWTGWKLGGIDRTEVTLDQREADTGPSNYLIVGSDSRREGDPLDPSAGDDHAPLADTIMLLRVDRATEEARVLSLPRDLWVTLSSTGEKGRINAAYAEGPQELIDTLRAELDVPINHYIEVDFNGFQELVTAVDGVPMWFDRAMRDPATGLEILHPGCITLDGRTALAFARSRKLQYFEDGGFEYDGSGDLGRISRQQLFLRRVIDRVDDQVSNPLTLKRLVEVGTENVTIDDELSVGELIALGQEFSSFESDQLETYTLPNSPRTTDGGAQIVELVPDEAAPILALFRGEDPTGGGSGDGTTTTAAPTQLDPGSITAMVLNSSGRQGLAVEVADDLVAAGFDVDHFGNGSELGHEREQTTVVRYAPGSEDEARRVAAQVASDAEVEEDETLDAESVVLFLGEDFTALADPDDRGSASTTTAGSEGDGAGSTSTTTAPEPEQSEAIGMVPGDPPEGRSCG